MSSDTDQRNIAKPNKTLIVAVLTLAATLILVGASALPVLADDDACLPSIDFDTDAGGNSLAAGTIITDTWAAWGVHVTTDDPANHPAMIFDSSNPTGGDPDLGTPNEDFGGPGIGAGGESGSSGENSLSLGKILIISEDNNPDDPDDDSGGGTITFTFDQPTSVDDVYIMDIEETGSKISAWDATTGGNNLVEINVPNYGDNSFQIVPVNAGGVRRLEVYFTGSGGVPAVVFCRDQGRIGDRVWSDEDGQGDQNAPVGTDEAGFDDVNVYLYATEPITCGVTTGWLAKTTTISGTSQTPDGWPDGIYDFDMGTLGLGTGAYWVCVDEDTLPDPGLGMQWTRTAGIHTTGSNPQKVTYIAGSNDFSIDFGYVATSDPTAVTLSSFAARSSAGGAVSPLWLGLAGVTLLAAGSLFWVKRRK